MNDAGIMHYADLCSSWNHAVLCAGHTCTCSAIHMARSPQSFLCQKRETFFLNGVVLFLPGVWFQIVMLSMGALPELQRDYLQRIHRESYATRCVTNVRFWVFFFLTTAKKVSLNLAHGKNKNSLLLKCHPTFLSITVWKWDSNDLKQPIVFFELPFSLCGSFF